MNEILLYEIYRQVLAANSLFQGRFVVAKNWGVSLNADNFEAEVTDALGGLISAQKYPCVILFPPTETLPDKTGYATLALTFLFLVQPSTYTAKKHVWDAHISPAGAPVPANRHFTPMVLVWKEMAGEARAFVAKLKETLSFNNLIRNVHPLTEGRIERISSTGNDGAAGVMLTGSQKIYFGTSECVDTSSYTGETPTITFPLFS